MLQMPGATWTSVDQNHSIDLSGVIGREKHKTAKTVFMTQKVIDSKNKGAVKVYHNDAEQHTEVREIVVLAQTTVVRSSRNIFARNQPSVHVSTALSTAVQGAPGQEPLTAVVSAWSVPSEGPRVQSMLEMQCLTVAVSSSCLRFWTLQMTACMPGFSVLFSNCAGACALCLRSSALRHSCCVGLDGSHLSSSSLLPKCIFLV